MKNHVEIPDFYPVKISIPKHILSEIGTLLLPKAGNTINRGQKTLDQEQNLGRKCQNKIRILQSKNFI